MPLGGGHGTAAGFPPPHAPEFAAMQITSLLTPYSLPVPHEDHVAIVDALYRFGAGQDLEDRALLESAFTADATLDFTGPARRFGVTLPVFEGRERIVEAIRHSTAALDTTHTVSNPRITAYDCERATLFALVEAQHVQKLDATRHLLLKNIYAVSLVHEHAVQWRINRMVISNVWYSGDAGVLFPR